jgi:hypothetical protein
VTLVGAQATEGDGWKPIETAPRNNTLIQACENTSQRFALYRCYWKNGKWVCLEFKFQVHPTHWRENRPEDRTAV